MADNRTTVTELATALGMTGHAALEAAVEARPESLEIGSGQWAGLEGILRSGAWTAVAETAFDNGAYFAAHGDGLKGRMPERIEWSGGRRMPGDRPVPADLLVDRVYLISCKYLSRIIHNTAPAFLFRDAPRRDLSIPWHRTGSVRWRPTSTTRSTREPSRFSGLTDMAESPAALNSGAAQATQGLPSRSEFAPGLPNELDSEYKLLIDSRQPKLRRSDGERFSDDRAEQERMLWRLLRSLLGDVLHFGHRRAAGHAVFGWSLPGSGGSPTSSCRLRREGGGTGPASGRLGRHLP